MEARRTGSLQDHRLGRSVDVELPPVGLACPVGLADWRGDVALELWVEADEVPVRIRLAGRLDATTAANLDEVVCELLADGTRAIELCTAGLRVVDASAIGSLADLERRVRLNGGTLSGLLRPSDLSRIRAQFRSASRPPIATMWAAAVPGPTARCRAPDARNIGLMSDGVSAGPPVISGHYPVGLETDEWLRDGSHLLVRPIRDGDGEAMTAFHESLSPRSVYRRFFYAHPHLSPGEVERFTTVDYVDRMALVVVDGDRIVGVGRYERLEGTDEAEVAFVVTDAYHRRGIGALLLDHLADVARTNGIAMFMAQTLSENRDMLGVFLASGFPVATSSEGGTVTVRLPIAACEEYVRNRNRRTSRVKGLPSVHDPGGGTPPDLLGR